MWPSGQVDSAWLRGKLWIVEDDTRTALSAPNPFRFCATMTATLDTLRRNLFTAALHGYGLYWFDLGNEGWFGSVENATATEALWRGDCRAIRTRSPACMPMCYL
jgi:hypothetical protein